MFNQHFTSFCVYVIFYCNTLSTGTWYKLELLLCLWLLTQSPLGLACGKPYMTGPSVDVHPSSLLLCLQDSKVSWMIYYLSLVPPLPLFQLLELHIVGRWSPSIFGTADRTFNGYSFCLDKQHALTGYLSQ